MLGPPPAWSAWMRWLGRGEGGMVQQTDPAHGELGVTAWEPRRSRSDQKAARAWNLQLQNPPLPSSPSCSINMPQLARASPGRLLAEQRTVGKLTVKVSRLQLGSHDPPKLPWASPGRNLEQRLHPHAPRLTRRRNGGRRHQGQPLATPRSAGLFLHSRGPGLKRRPVGWGPGQRAWDPVFTCRHIPFPLSLESTCFPPPQKAPGRREKGHKRPRGSCSAVTLPG